MDHAEALERIEIAAAEPDGLERLMAGDTPESAAVAGHLAGCSACGGELARIGRVAAVARSVIATEPDPALKALTLAFVRAHGEHRPAGRVLTPVTTTRVAAPMRPDAADLATIPSSATRSAVPMAAPRRRLPFTRVAGMAAALLLAGVAGFGLAGGFAQETADDDSAPAVLAGVAATALDLAAAPGTTVLPLAPTPAGGDATGRVAFNGGSGELVMLATGLATPADGAEYGCWVEADGERRRIGTLYAAGENLWGWSGVVDGLDALPDGTVFGVSLGAPGGGAPEPVLLGGT